MTIPTTARVSGTITPEALIDLIGELGREAYWLLDDCETSSGPDGAEVHQITTEGLEKLSAILDRIEALPFSEENVILGPGAMLQLALRQTFLAAIQPDPEPRRNAWSAGLEGGELVTHIPSDPEPAATRSCTELVAQLSAALEDAINAPKGVVPKSAEPFYDGFQGRVRMPDPDIGNPIAPEPEPQPVAWTGNGSLMALQDGRDGFIWPHKADAHPVPLYATPSSAGMVSVEAARELEGAVNWLDALLTLIEETSCEPDDEERFEEVLMGAQLWLKRGRAALRALAGERG